MPPFPPRTQAKRRSCWLIPHCSTPSHIAHLILSYPASLTHPSFSYSILVLHPPSSGILYIHTRGCYGLCIRNQTLAFAWRDVDVDVMRSTLFGTLNDVLFAFPSCFSEYPFPFFPVAVCVWQRERAQGPGFGVYVYSEPWMPDGVIWIEDWGVGLRETRGKKRENMNLGMW